MQVVEANGKFQYNGQAPITKVLSPDHDLAPRLQMHCFSYSYWMLTV